MKDPYQKPEPEKVLCTATSRELTEDELDDVRAGYTPFGCYEERDTIIVILGSLIIDRVHKPLDGRVWNHPLRVWEEMRGRAKRLVTASLFSIYNSIIIKILEKY